MVELAYCLDFASALSFHPVQSFPFRHSKTRVLSIINRQHQRELTCAVSCLSQPLGGDLLPDSRAIGACCSGGAQIRQNIGDACKHRLN